jgi:hypothetical protein
LFAEKKKKKKRKNEPVDSFAGHRRRVGGSQRQTAGARSEVSGSHCRVANQTGEGGFMIDVFVVVDDDVFVVVFCRL